MDRPRQRLAPSPRANWRDARVLAAAEVEAPGVREIAVPERIVWVRLRGGRWWPGLQDAWRYLPASGSWAARIAFGPDQEPRWYQYKGVALHGSTSSGYPPGSGDHR